MQFLKLNLVRSVKDGLFSFFLAGLSTIWLISSATIRADDKQELSAVGDLLSILEGDDPVSEDEIDKLLTAIPDASGLKQVAEQTVALIHIRTKNYSKAWKDLTSTKDSIPPDETKLSRERLKLWLLMEAGAPEKAEAQFKWIVKAAADPSSTGSEQAAACAFLGRVDGMLQSNDAAPIIQANTIQTGKAFLLKMDIKNVAALWDEQETEIGKWGKDLIVLANEFKSMGIQKANALNAATQAENEQAQKEQMELRGNLKLASSGKKDLEENRRKGIKMKNAMIQEMKKPTAGKPLEPRPPGNPPIQPRAPQGRNQVDPKTLAAKYVPPTAEETNRYQDELRVFQERFRNWQQLNKLYEREKREFAAKLENWYKLDSERRANLQARKQEAEDATSAAEKAMKDLKDEIKDGVAKELKDSSDQSEILKRKALISSIALTSVFSDDPKIQRVIRPANFQLLDYDSESLRLRKAMR